MEEKGKLPNGTALVLEAIESLSSKDLQILRKYVKGRCSGTTLRIPHHYRQPVGCAIGIGGAKPIYGMENDD